MPVAASLLTFTFSAQKSAFTLSTKVDLQRVADGSCRGLDIPGKVNHVINFDFPLNPDDYLHRTGRTARAGASGRVTSLVQKKERLLASRIEQALQAKQPIDSLTNAPNAPARSAWLVLASCMSP